MIPKTKKFLKKLNESFLITGDFIGKIIKKSCLLFHFLTLFILNEFLKIFKLNIININVSFKSMILNIIKD
jgi:hypothetical protein